MRLILLNEWIWVCGVYVLRFAERRIVDLKKRIDELRYEIVGANAELEDAKRDKELAEQDIKGYEVELAMKEASIQTLEVCFSLIEYFDAHKMYVYTYVTYFLAINWWFYSDLF